MKNRTLVTVPFNPEWMDKNGYMTNAWTALNEYPNADRLVGSMSQPGDRVSIPEGMLEASRLDHDAVGGFVISKDRITHTFLYHKSRLDPNGLTHLGTITVPAIAKIVPGVVNVYLHIQEARGYGALLESWHLTSKCSINGVSKEKEWVLTERAVHLVYSPSYLIQNKHKLLEMLPINKSAMIKTLVHHLNQSAIAMNIVALFSADFTLLQRRINHASLNVVASPSERNWWYRWYLETDALIMADDLSDAIPLNVTLTSAQTVLIRRRFDIANERLRHETT